MTRVLPSLSELQNIPGVGPTIARDFLRLGVKRVRDLAGADPALLYKKLEKIEGGHVDRCMLYVFASAVYFASHARRDPRLLLWWNWKERMRHVSCGHGA